jgi:hypothetical protein
MRFKFKFIIQEEVDEEEYEDDEVEWYSLRNCNGSQEEDFLDDALDELLIEDDDDTDSKKYSFLFKSSNLPPEKINQNQCICVPKISS